MATHQRIQSLDIWALARSGGAIQGSTSVSEMPRLQAMCAAPAQHPVSWHVQGLLKPGPDGQDRAWMVLQVEAQLPVECVRCLQPVEQTLHIERDFRFVADEATALAEDADCEEDLLALTPPLDGLHLIEDELLMALPLLPKHDSCNSEYSPTSLEDAASEKTHPFAALAQWRKSGDPGK